MNTLRKFSPSKKNLHKKDEVSDSEIIQRKGRFSPSKISIFKRGQESDDSPKRKQKGKFSFRRKKSSNSSLSLDNSVTSEVTSADQTSSSTTEDKIYIEDHGSLSCDSPNEKRLEQVRDDPAANPSDDPAANPSDNLALTEMAKAVDYKGDEEKENMKHQELSIVKKDSSEESNSEYPEDITEEREPSTTKEEVSEEPSVRCLQDSAGIQQGPSVVEEKVSPGEPEVESLEYIPEQQEASTRKNLSKETIVECAQSNVEQHERPITKRDSLEKSRVEREQEVYIAEKDLTDEPDCFFLNCFITRILKSQPLL